MLSLAEIHQLVLEKIYYYLPLEKAWPFMYINLNPFHSVMLYSSLVEIDPMVLGDEDRIVQSLQQ